MTNLSDRIDVLEGHVASQDRDNPGLLMRVDRLEWFVKALIALTSLGVIWRAIDVVGQFLAGKALDQ